jgi:hypothetical protein
MANMDITTRAQVERIDLSETGGTRLLGASRRGLAIYTALGLLLLPVLIWAAFAGVDEWYQWAVLGAFVTTTIGLMIAVSPSRRG